MHIHGQVLCGAAVHQRVEYACTYQQGRSTCWLDLCEMRCKGCSPKTPSSWSKADFVQMMKRPR